MMIYKCITSDIKSIKWSFKLNTTRPAGGRGASISACADLTNQLRLVLLTGLASSFCMGFQNFVVSDKIHPLKKNANSCMYLK